MKFFLSAFRNRSNPAGYDFAANMPFATIDDAMDWIYGNIFHARNDQAVLRFDAIADRKGIAEMVSEYEGEWSQQNFDQLNGVETIIIQRADVVNRRAEEV